MDSVGTYRSTQTRKYSFSLTKENLAGKGSDPGVFGDLINGRSEYSLDDNKEEKTEGDSPDTSLMDRYDSMNTGLNPRVKEVEKGDVARSIEDVRNRFVLYLWRMFFGQERADEMADRYGLKRLDTTGSYSMGAYSSGSMPGFSIIRIDAVQEVHFEESQELNFTSQGHVTTEDGRSIDFNLDVSMSSSFSAYYKEEVQGALALCDPLVINFGGDIADLTDTKFRFDLDCDGEEEEISTLASGSGFLALDSNGDGIVNDGSELFGTKTGDGFSDLKVYDSDGNGWIDENDDIFDRLKIWVKEADGTDTLHSLKDSNVGAIYLGSVDTTQVLRSMDTGNVNGMLRRTGIFLYEDGTGVGTMSHLDIAN